jgi:hypothetical protein
MENLGMMKGVAERLSSSLLHQILEPCTATAAMEVSTSISAVTKVATVTCKDTSISTGAEAKPIHGHLPSGAAGGNAAGAGAAAQLTAHPSQVLSRITTVIEAVREHVLSCGNSSGGGGGGGGRQQQHGGMGGSASSGSGGAPVEGSVMYRMAILGSFLWTPLCTRLTSDEGAVLTWLPKQADRASSLQALRVSVETFTIRMDHLGLTSSSGGGGGSGYSVGMDESEQQRLCVFLSNIDTHMSSKDRRDTLLRARNLIMSGEHNTVQVNDATERGTLRDLARYRYLPLPLSAFLPLPLC